MSIRKKIALPLTLILLGFILGGCEDKSASKDKATKTVQVVPVKVHTLEKKVYPIWVDFTGKTEAFKDVDITSRVTGELKSIHFKSGDVVQKDQLLFQIDDTEYKAILAQKNATLKKNQASLKLAIANVNRYKPLVKKQLAPKEKLDELIAKKEELQATVKADESTIKQAKLNVDYCQVKATITGYIGKNLLDIGNIVSNSSKLANIVQSDTLYVNFTLSDREIFLYNKYKSEKFPPVQVLPEEITDTTQSLKGRIDFVDNVTNNSTGTIAIRAKINNEKHLLYPGSFVNIKLFITADIPVIALHPNTILQDQQGTYVYVVKEDSTLEKRIIVVDYSNKDLALIKSGLSEGEKIVVSATKRLRTSQKVSTTEVPNPIKL